jgi:hypothetical protein
MSPQEQKTLLEAIANTVKTTPNDQDLGEKIRKMVNPDLKIPSEKKVYY